MTVLLAVKQRFAPYVIIVPESKKPILKYQNVPEKYGGIGLISKIGDKSVLGEELIRLNR